MEILQISNSSFHSHKVSVPIHKYIFSIDIHSFKELAYSEPSYTWLSLYFQSWIRFRMIIPIKAKNLFHIRNLLQYLLHLHNCKANLVWITGVVPGHAGEPGNELANELARSIDPTACLLSFSCFTQITFLIYRAASSIYLHHPSYFNSKISYHSIYLHTEPFLLTKPWFVTLTRLFRKLLGSICCLGLGYHCFPAPLARFILNLSPYCPLCPDTFTLVTSNHVLHCPELQPITQNFKQILSLSETPRPWLIITSLLAILDPLVPHRFAQFIAQLFPYIYLNLKMNNLSQPWLPSRAYQLDPSNSYFFFFFNHFFFYFVHKIASLYMLYISFLYLISCIK